MRTGRLGGESAARRSLVRRRRTVARVRPAPARAVARLTARARLARGLGGTRSRSDPDRIDPRLGSRPIRRGAARGGAVRGRELRQRRRGRRARESAARCGRAARGDSRHRRADRRCDHPRRADRRPRDRRCARCVAALSRVVAGGGRRGTIGAARRARHRYHGARLPAVGDRVGGDGARATRAHRVRAVHPRRPGGAAADGRGALRTRLELWRGVRGARVRTARAGFRRSARRGLRGAARRLRVDRRTFRVPAAARARGHHRRRTRGADRQRREPSASRRGPGIQPRDARRRLSGGGGGDGAPGRRHPRRRIGAGALPAVARPGPCGGCAVHRRSRRSLRSPVLSGCAAARPGARVPRLALGLLP